MEKAHRFSSEEHSKNDNAINAVQISHFSGSFLPIAKEHLQLKKKTQSDVAPCDWGTIYSTNDAGSGVVLRLGYLKRKIWDKSWRNLIAS